jgi:hypothetical protein
MPTPALRSVLTQTPMSTTATPDAVAEVARPEEEDEFTHRSVMAICIDRFCDPVDRKDR